MVCQVTGKLVYDSKREAIKVQGCISRRTPKDRCRHTQKWAKGTLKAYFCAHCKKFHIGHEVAK